MYYKMRWYNADTLVKLLLNNIVKKTTNFTPDSHRDYHKLFRKAELKICLIIELIISEAKSVVKNTMYYLLMFLKAIPLADT